LILAFAPSRVHNQPNEAEHAMEKVIDLLSGGHGVRDTPGAARSGSIAKDTGIAPLVRRQGGMPPVAAASPSQARGTAGGRLPLRALSVAQLFYGRAYQILAGIIKRARPATAISEEAGWFVP
jgi:hypothetical protein